VGAFYTLFCAAEEVVSDGDLRKLPPRSDRRRPAEAIAAFGSCRSRSCPGSVRGHQRLNSLAGSPSLGRRPSDWKLPVGLRSASDMMEDPANGNLHAPYNLNDPFAHYGRMMASTVVGVTA
jgi:hypothetical protein